MERFTNGTRVAIHGTILSGTIVANFILDEKTLFVVKLDEGFKSEKIQASRLAKLEDKTLFVSSLICAPENITEIITEVISPVESTYAIKGNVYDLTKLIHEGWTKNDLPVPHEYSKDMKFGDFFDENGMYLGATNSTSPYGIIPYFNKDSLKLAQK